MTEEYNQLLRSAYKIAERKGQGTNWDTFKDCLLEELLIQVGAPAESKDEQIILDATTTERIYKK